ncbi:conserved hypothetical protein [delta proteobacterium NaphS2]|nr:conserved hypothetical protein [delta proteobacterium NaphS2]
MESILPLLSSAMIPIIQIILTKENVQLYGDRLFDLAEDVIKDSRTQWDDAALLPIIIQFRQTLDIPDLPGRWPLKKILLQRRLELQLQEKIPRPREF